MPSQSYEEDLVVTLVNKLLLHGQAFLQLFLQALQEAVQQRWHLLLPVFPWMQTGMSRSWVARLWTSHESGSCLVSVLDAGLKPKKVYTFSRGYSTA